MHRLPQRGHRNRLSSRDSLWNHIPDRYLHSLIGISGQVCNAKHSAGVFSQKPLRASDAPRRSDERSANRLLVYGDTDNISACKDALRRWLARKTKEHVVPWLIRLAQERELEFGSAVVKSQRTRRASCSSKKTISLNLRLLCLPEELVRYVLLHELAHCRYMNHSRKFWAEVRSFAPDCERLDAELRNAWRHIPAWLGPTPMPELL